MNTKNLKAIVFDIDGVLLDHEINGKYCWLNNAKQDLGIEPAILATMHNNAPEWNQMSLGKKKLETYLEEFVKQKQINITAKKLLDYFVKNDCYIRDYMINEVKKINKKNKYQLYIGTHQEFNKGEYLWLNKGLNKYFKNMFTSYTVGHLKTEKEFFDVISDKINIDPGCIMLIDDKNKNVEQAINSGWQGYLYTTFADIKTNLFNNL